MFAGVLFTACDKDQPGETATKALAGEWYVIVDGVDNAGNVVYADPFGGRVMLYTFNTAANDPSKMYMMDEQNPDAGPLWLFKVKMQADVNALTFSTNGEVTSETILDEEDEDGKPIKVPYDIDVNIEDGRVIPGGTINPHGTVADSIVFYVTFSDDEYIPDLWDKLRVSGFRYTGFESDN